MNKFWISGWDPKGYPLGEGIITVFVTKEDPRQPYAFEVIPVKDAFEEAAQEVQGWIDLRNKDHAMCDYVDPKEAEREHGNLIRQLECIKDRLLEKSGIERIKLFRDRIKK